MRTTFPTLADVERKAWPARLRIIPPDPAIGGDVERITCGCYREVPAAEMMDLRALSPAQLTALGITRPLQCAACFHHAGLCGDVLHGAVAEALGMHTTVVQSLHSGAKEAVRRGWHAITDRNRHLKG